MSTPRTSGHRSVRALLAFIALPGMVAFVIPLTLFRPAHLARPVPAVAVVVLTLGVVVLLWCVRDFHVVGKGTLAPWAPPRQLVRVGFYRVSRNPMYLGVLLVVFGWALAFRSSSLATYGAALAVAFHVRVVLGEEPWLARTHGASWEEYRARIRRWF